MAGVASLQARPPTLHVVSRCSCNAGPQALVRSCVAGNEDWTGLSPIADEKEFIVVYAQVRAAAALLLPSAKRTYKHPWCNIVDACAGPIGSGRVRCRLSQGYQDCAHGSKNCWTSWNAAGCR
jgi:hypothetical protein